MPDAFSYVVKCTDSEGHEVYVGPFDYKFRARQWLLEETGSPHGLVLLVLSPRDKESK